jgi:DNA repair exonuclease SbcCD ATPase subunit
MVRVALACIATFLSGSTASEQFSEHTGLLQKNRGQVGDQILQGVRAHTANDPLIDDQLEFGTCNFAGLLCPHEKFNEMQAYAEAEKQRITKSITDKEETINKALALLSQANVEAEDYSTRAETVTQTTATVESDLEILRQEMAEAETEFNQKKTDLDASILELSKRIDNGIVQVQQVIASLSQDAGDASPALAQLKRREGYFERKARELFEKLARAACSVADEYFDHKCHSKMVASQEEHQRAIDKLRNDFANVEESLRTALTNRDAAVDARSNAKEDFDTLKAALDKAQDLLSTMQTTFNTKTDERAANLDSLKILLKDFEADAAEFAQSLAGVLGVSIEEEAEQQ